MAGYYELKRAAGTQFMFNLIGGNGEKILTSETYLSKQGALNGIQSVKAHSPTDANYRRESSSGGSPYFVLKASNGETLGRSEMYSSTAARETGIQSCKTNGPTAPVRDST